MEQLLVLILLAVAALIFGYLFIKNYNKIDIRHFGRIKSDTPTLVDGVPKFDTGVDPGYSPFGRVQVLVSALIGALFTGIPILHRVFYVDLDEKSLTLALTLALLIIVSYNLYEAVTRMPTAGKRIGKFFFLTAACAVGAGVGALGTLLIFAAAVFYLIFLAVKIALFGTPEKQKKEQPGGCRYRSAGWCTATANRGNRCPYHGGFERCSFKHDPM